MPGTFAAADEVAALLEAMVAVLGVAPHTDDNDPYAVLAELGGFDVSTAERGRTSAAWPSSYQLVTLGPTDRQSER